MSRATGSDFNYGRDSGLAAPTREQAQAARVWLASRVLAGVPAGERRGVYVEMTDMLGIGER